MDFLGLTADLQPPDTVLFTFRHIEAAVAGRAGHVFAAGLIIHQDGERAFGLLFGSGQEHQDRLGQESPQVSIRVAITHLACN